MRRSLRWHGPVFDWSSHAELARGFIRGLHHAGVHCAASLPGQSIDGPTLDEICRPGELLDWMMRLSDARPMPAVFCGLPVAADGFDLSTFIADRELDVPHAVYAMCETDRVHPSWVDTLGETERVWVPSRFCAEAFQAGGVDPNRISVVRPGTEPVATADLARRRARHLDEPFTFVSIQARGERKNLTGLTEAFVTAFTADPQVRLVIKTTPPLGGQQTTRELVRVHLDALGVPAEPGDLVEIIEVIEEQLPRSEIGRLLDRADAFVLPSHGEAIGLPYLEALMRCVPVIATRWGGQLDFLDDDVADLVAIDGLVAVPESASASVPHFAGLRWARPNHDHLVETLRRVRFDHAAALARADCGRTRLLEHWTDAAAGHRMAAALDDLVAATRVPRPHRPTADAAVAWTGVLYGANSFSVEGREYVFALDDAGVAIGIEPAPGPGPPLDLDEPTRTRLRRLRMRLPAERWIDIQLAEPAALGPRDGARASIGRTMFEAEGLPDGWLDRCRAMTELWFPSQSTADMFVRSGLDPDKVHVIPETVPDEHFDPPADSTRLPAAAFVFLSVFDWQYRKGWDVLLRGYAEAFDDTDDVALAILTHSMLRYSRADITRMAHDAMRTVRPDRLPRVVFLDGPVPEPEMGPLFASADAYVLATRGEGWGRPFASAMAANTLVVATDRGGHREFAHDDNALLVPSRLVPVPEHAGRERAVYAGLRWNEPDPSALASALRHAVDGDHRGRIARARRGIERYRRPAIAAQMAARIEALLAS